MQSTAPIASPSESGSADSLAISDQEKQAERVNNPLAGLSELKALRRWFDENPSENKGWVVLSALIDESLKKVSASDSSRRFDDDDLRAATGKDDWKWGEVAVWWDKRENQVHQSLISSGADSLPFPSRSHAPVKTGRGNKATNAWLCRPLQAAVTEAIAAEQEHGEVIYEIDAEPVRLTGLFRRKVFQHGEIRRHSLRGKLLGWRVWLSALALIAFGAFVMFDLLFSSKAIVSPRDIALILVAIGGFWMWRSDWKPLHLASEDRIAALPNDWLKSDQQPAQLEWRRTEHGEVLRLVRYTTTCPVCGAQVCLMSGTPEWPRRMFGRCSDAPREHVMTFDPVTRKGRLMPLRNGTI